MFNVNDLKTKSTKNARYRRQIERITAKNGYTKNIEQAVEGAIKNVQEKCRSFVIYGEPQSGKTEMMIALTARLLDEGQRIIIVLMNDSIQLLSQNLERFRRSGIDPAPKNFSEVLDPVVTIGEGEWVIFSKKNPKDLSKLLEKIGNIDGKVIIDDEADYATPNSKVNKGEKTRINELIGKLIGFNGIYVGVTATPARLDLNNTFMNENEKWVDFPPHPLYKGQDVFFPTTLDKGALEFNLRLLPDTEDAPKYLREALTNFLVNVAHINLKINADGEKNYCILIHTSGKRVDHTNDYEEVVKYFNVLKQEDDERFEKYYWRIWEVARERYPGEEDEIAQYVSYNRSRNTIVVMNSDTDKNVVDYTSATNPSTLFTVAIGGNIVSRGVTFDNLLSMFFTRDVKHKIQQDTYIQRARMFGSRGPYILFFELHIPEKLYLDWHKCFVFHKLSLTSRRSGNGSPVWLEDTRVAAVSPSSIDKTTVSFDSGEMSFEIFDYDEDIEKIINAAENNFNRLVNLAKALGSKKIPDFLLEYIQHFSPSGDDSIAIHPSKTIAGYKDANQEKIERARGFIGNFELEKDKRPNAIHHLKILFNSQNKARLFYKYDGNIKFLKNLKKSTDA
jgi:hypothetical protein